MRCKHTGVETAAFPAVLVPGVVRESIAPIGSTRDGTRVWLRVEQLSTIADTPGRAECWMDQVVRVQGLEMDAAKLAYSRRRVCVRGLCGAA